MTQQIITTEEYNKQVQSWSASMRNELKKQISMLSSKGKKELVSSLRYKSKQEFGEIVSIGFEFARHGVFWHYGVGRGYVREGGMVKRGRNASVLEEIHAANKNRKIGKILSKSNSSRKRIPKEWFDPVYDKRIDKLADIIADYHGDQFLVDFDKMKIHK